jgi:hypothetical protein
MLKLTLDARLFQAGYNAAMMTRAILKMTIPLLLIFGLLVGLIRTQAGDHRELRAALLPPQDCEVPCWQGIHPGSTTFGQVVEILEAHPWVSKVIVAESGRGALSNLVSWKWSGRQPDWIRGERMGFLWISRNLVWSLYIPTRIPFGEVWLAADQPPQVSIEVNQTLRLPKSVAYLSQFSDLGFMTQHAADCPVHPADLWQRPVSLQFVSRLYQKFPDDRLGWWFKSACE